MSRPVENAACPVCQEEGRGRQLEAGGYSIKCPACGTYEITAEAAGQMRSIHNAAALTPRQIANARGWLRDNQGVRVTTSDIDAIPTRSAPSIGGRAERILKLVAARSSEIGDAVEIPFAYTTLMPFMAASWSTTDTEVLFLVDEYLVREKKWLSETPDYGNNYRITPAGYEYLEQLRSGTIESNIGFCAMWFGENVKPAWTGAIEPAIRLAGYDPIRIDGVQHNNKIDDEILAYIRRSKFVIADFTGYRGGVYFEAGFALGLGRQVIWTVEESELAQVHFDNRQYNFTTWKLDALPAFAKRLQLRIEATMGRGPLVV